MLPERMIAIQQDAVDLGACVVCGTRGWMIPNGEAELSEEDARITRREVLRLELALEAAKRIAGDRPVVVMLHYPPLSEEPAEIRIYRTDGSLWRTAVRIRPPARRGDPRGL